MNILIEELQKAGIISNKNYATERSTMSNSSKAIEEALHEAGIISNKMYAKQNLNTAYGLMLTDWQDRVRLERAELKIKICNLKKFINSAKYSELPQRQQELLARQYDVMNEYVAILSLRLDL